MPEPGVLANSTPGERQARSPLPQRERLVVEHDPQTGARLKYFSRAADVEYWTSLWRRHAGGVSYEREEAGHLPHQLRGVFRRWIPSRARVLEAGCGLGHFTVAAAARARRAEGLDWSAETIDGLQRRFPTIPWHIGDVRHLPFATGTFDAVYSPGVCEHFEEGPAEVLTETRRVLKAGGIAFVSTPCFNTWLQRRARAIQQSSPPCGDAAFYQYAFTPGGMTKLLGHLGFEVLEVRPYAVLHTFERYEGWRVPCAVREPLAVALDYVPIVRRWGSTCLWVARKC